MFAALLTLSIAGAAPSSLQQAAAALEELQYEEALKLLPPEAEIRGYSREELITWYSTRALAQLNLKKDAEAAESLRRLFTFAPEWQLPDQYGPRVVTLVAGLRAEAETRGLLTLAATAGAVEASWDTTGLARELELSWREGGVKTARLPLAAKQPAPWPRGTTEVWGRILGLEGSTLVEWHSEKAPLNLAPPVAKQAVTAAALSKPLGSLAFAGMGTALAGVVAVALGAGFAADSRVAEKALLTVSRDISGRITSPSQREAFALDSRASSSGTAAGVLFVAGGALLATGVGLFAFDRVSVAASPGGATLTVPLDAHFLIARSPSTP